MLGIGCIFMKLRCDAVFLSKKCTVPARTVSIEFVVSKFKGNVKESAKFEVPGTTLLFSPEKVLVPPRQCF